MLGNLGPGTTDPKRTVRPVLAPLRNLLLVWGLGFGVWSLEFGVSLSQQLNSNALGLPLQEALQFNHWFFLGCCHNDYVTRMPSSTLIPFLGGLG